MIKNENDVFRDEDFLLDFFSQLKKKNKEIASDIFEKRKKDKIKISGSSIDGYSSIITTFNIFHNINPNEIQESLTDGFDDCSFDVIYLDGNKLDIFDIKGGSEGFSLTDLKVLRTNIKDYIIDRDSFEELSNELLKKKLEELKTFLDSTQNPTINLFITRESKNTISLTYKKQINKIISECAESGINLNIEIYNSNLLLKKLKSNILNVTLDDSIKISMNLSQGVTSFDGVSFVITSLYNLILFIDECNSKGLNNLYKYNVREDKEEQSLIDGIKNTILKYPERFLYYHNGITIIADNIELNNNSIFLSDPQVVNGCQSTNAIYKSFKKNLDLNILYSKFENIEEIGKHCSSFEEEMEYKNLLNEVIINSKLVSNLKKSFVQLKVLNINTDNSLLLEKISEYSNKQIKIDGFELRSNDLINQLIEKHVKMYGYDFIRKSSEESKNRLDYEKFIKIDEFYQILYSIFTEKPQTSKSSKDSIFSLENKQYSYINLLDKIDFNLILKVFISNKYFYEIFTSKNDGALKFYFVMSLILLDTEGKINILESDNTSLKKISNDIKGIIDNVKTTYYYNKKDIYRNYGNEIWVYIKKSLLGKDFNIDLFIKSIKELGGKGALVMSLRGSNIKFDGKKIIIEVKTKLSFTQLDKIESKDLITKALEFIGFSEIKIEINNI